MVVADKLKERAMELICPGLQAGIDDRAHRVSVLRGCVGGDELEFLNRVDVGRIAYAVVLRLIGVHAVQTEVIRLRAIAVDERPAASRSGESGDVVGDNSRSEQCELGEVPAVQ